MHQQRHLSQLPAVLAELLLLAGCGIGPQSDYSDLELIEVTGRVTLDDVPLADAKVDFESPDLTAASGRTNEDGEYQLMFDSVQPGCLPGEKIVRISMRPSGDDEDPDAVQTSKIAIPERYNTDSKLRAEVSADQDRFDFDLKTAE